MTAGFLRKLLRRKIRVVFATNVVIAAITNPRSASARLVEEALQGSLLQICLSPAVISEYEYILRSFRVALARMEDRADFIFALKKNACLTNPTVKTRRIKDDTSDNKFLECAVSAKAQYIVTSDKHFSFKSYRGVKVTKPAEMEKELFRI